MKFFAGFTIGTILFNLFLFAGYVTRAKSEAEPEAKLVAVKEPEFVACDRTGCFYCMGFERDGCGVNLTKCADARDHYCLHDVTIKFDQTE